MTPLDLLTRALADQHGVVSRRQLQRMGYTSSSIDRLVCSRRLYRAYAGIYSAVPTLTRDARAVAAWLAAGPVAAESHESAADAWSFWPRRDHRIIVTSASSKRLLDGVELVRTQSLPAHHVCLHRGRIVTTPSRTLVDLADHHSPYLVAAAMHQADFHGRLDLASIEATMRETNGRHGGRCIRRALALHRSDSWGTGSLTEDRFLELVAEAGLPEPEVGVAVHGKIDQYRLDTFWRGIGLNCEVDGGPHRRRKSQRDDAERDADLVAVGIRVERFAGWDIWNHPERAIRRLRQTFAS